MSEASRHTCACAKAARSVTRRIEWLVRLSDASKRFRCTFIGGGQALIGGLQALLYDANPKNRAAWKKVNFAWKRDRFRRCHALRPVLESQERARRPPPRRRKAREKRALYGIQSERVVAIFMRCTGSCLLYTSPSPR